MKANSILDTIGNAPHIRINLFGASAPIPAARTGPHRAGAAPAIAQKLPELPKGARVLGLNYDTSERYLSIEGFLPA